MNGALIYFVRPAAKRVGPKKTYGNLDFPQADNCLISGARAPERVGNHSNLSGLTDLLAKPSLHNIK
jgi:hypothetical protein